MSRWSWVHDCQALPFAHLITMVNTFNHLSNNLRQPVSRSIFNSASQFVCSLISLSFQRYERLGIAIARRDYPRPTANESTLEEDFDHHRRCLQVRRNSIVQPPTILWIQYGRLTVQIAGYHRPEEEIQSLSVRWWSSFDRCDGFAWSWCGWLLASGSQRYRRAHGNIYEEFWLSGRLHRRKQSNFLTEDFSHHRRTSLFEGIDRSYSCLFAFGMLLIQHVSPRRLSNHHCFNYHHGPRWNQWW